MAELQQLRSEAEAAISAAGSAAELEELRVRYLGRKSQLTSTLREYYEEKRSFYAVDFPSTYDRELCRVFSNSPKYANRELATRFITRNAKEIRTLVARWTGESEFTIDQLLHDMIARSRRLKLRVPGGEGQVLLDFAGMLAVRSVHFLYRRRESIPL